MSRSNVPRIRRAGEADLDAVACIGRATFAAHFGSWWTPAGLAEHLERDFKRSRLAEELAAPDVHYWLAEAEGRVAGFAKLKTGSASPSGRGCGLELQKLYFEPGSTGRGWGTRMLGEALDFAREYRQPFLWLDVFKPNLRARRLYERAGFEVAGERPFASDRWEIGQWVMERPLQP